MARYESVLTKYIYNNNTVTKCKNSAPIRSEWWLWLCQDTQWYRYTRTYTSLYIYMYLSKPPSSHCLRNLTYRSTSLDPVTGVVVRSGYRRQFTVGRSNVSQFIAQVRAAFVQGRVSVHWLVVDNVICNVIERLASLVVGSGRGLAVVRFFGTFLHHYQYIQSLLNRVCSGPRERRDKATQITRIPTIITTTVAPTGTATFRSTQSGIQGKNCLTSGISLAGGAMVPGCM